MATELVNIILLLITLPVIAGVLLVARAYKMSVLLSFSALVEALIIGAYLNFSGGCFHCTITILDYLKPFPFVFPLVSSLVMIGLLYTGWKGYRRQPTISAGST